MTNQPSAAEIAELVCTRLSHDVIGNIGAVANAVELLEEGDMDFLDDIKSILKTSSAVLSARLKFFRLAFGLDNANLDKLDLVEETIRGYLKTIGNQNYPIELDFNLRDSRYSKGVLLTVMIVADCLIRGGCLHIGTDSSGRVTVSAECSTPPSAEKMAQIRAVLTGENAELNAQFAPVFYLLSWLKKAKINLYIQGNSRLGFIMASTKDNN